MPRMTSSGIPPHDPFRAREVGDVSAERARDLSAREQSGLPRSPFRTALLGVFHRFVSLLEKKASSRGISLSKGGLRLFLSLLERMCEEDVSENGFFLQELSHAWHQILQERDYFSSTFLGRLEEWMDEVRSFPKGAEYSLGYYLFQRAGSAWIPFPYMKIVKDLHQDFILRREKGILQRWREKLRELLDDPP